MQEIKKLEKIKKALEPLIDKCYRENITQGDCYGCAFRPCCDKAHELWNNILS